ncbi:MAG: hypothetical protein RL701_688 [Pseudomonadota bacterium]
MAHSHELDIPGNHPPNAKRLPLLAIRTHPRATSSALLDALRSVSCMLVVGALVTASGCQPALSTTIDGKAAPQITPASCGIPDPAVLRGLLASDAFAGLPLKGVFFYPGDVAAYNQQLYTAHPTKPEDMHWNSDASARADVIDRIAATHANTVVLSYWGDEMSQWSPMQVDATSVSNAIAGVDGTNLLIMPALESGFDAQNASTPHWRFAEEFPYRDGEQSPANLAPGLIERIHRLAALFRERPESWARMFDRTGKARFAIHIVHACSLSVPSATGISAGELIAQAFDAVADEIARTDGIDVGFTLDIVPGGAAGVTYTPETSGAAFEASNSILAIQGFISEIHTGRIKIGPPNGAAYDNNVSNLQPILAAKRAQLDAWAQTELPVIVDASSGFDGRFVWGANGAGFWGDNLDYTSDEWRNAMSALKGGAYAGITFATWNGYTEGYAAVPTVEHGSVIYDWLTDLYQQDPRLCDHTEYVDGQRAYRVRGVICGKWRAVGAGYGALGAPVSDEAESATQAQVVRFEHGVVFKSDAVGTHEVHGAIAEMYERMGYDASCLGLPISDEEPYQNGRVSHFEAGDITFVNGRAAANCS